MCATATKDRSQGTIGFVLLTTKALSKKKHCIAELWKQRPSAPQGAPNLAPGMAARKLGASPYSLLLHLLLHCFSYSASRGEVSVEKAIKEANKYDLRALIVKVPAPPNLVFVKVPKAASSTSAGIARRIADRWGLSGVEIGSNAEFPPSEFLPFLLNSFREPVVFANHADFRDVRRLLVDRLVKPVFIWTMLRDPAVRCMSQFYHYEVILKGREATLDNKLAWARGYFCRNYQFNSIKPSDTCVDTKCALKPYDFVGLAEYYEESMVQLAMTARTPLAAVLFVPSKTHLTDKVAPSSPMAGHRRELVELSLEPDELRSFLSSAEFVKHNNRLDYQLVGEVRSRVVPKLGDNRSRAVQTLLPAYRAALQAVALACQGTRTNNSGGYSGDCYWGDNGCQRTCIDAVVSSL